MDFEHLIVKIKLAKSNVSVIIPGGWIMTDDNDHINILNYGTVHNKKQWRIFFSSNINASPNFDIETSVNFDNNVEANYMGRIVDAMSEYG